ncbi:MAG: YbhB/YbcL family Raf kinase inhibitor-like protein [Cyclobacteriaceae bacterium]
MHLTEQSPEYKPLHISSPSFEANQLIPSKYTCEGKDINPSLEIAGIPEKAHSLVLIVEDPDAPGKTWVHWLVWNIPITHHIMENSVPGEQGRNDFKRVAWGGPCPPSGTHRYFFKVYALDTLLKLSSKTTKKELEQAMGEHILAFGELVGVYKRQGL